MKRMFFAICSLLIVGCVPNYISKSYHGEAWKKQTIPGKIECEWYDKGGESVAYHDSDAINNGSGKLNPANGSFLNEFRMKEGVDISYTKPGGIDDNSYSNVSPRNESTLCRMDNPR